MSREAILELSTYPVTCPVCGERLVRLDANHAKQHGFQRLRDFKETHGIDYETLQQRSRKKLLSLYNVDRTRWAIVYWKDADSPQWGRKQYRADYAEARRAGISSANRFPLSDTAFNHHMTGAQPLAILASGKHSSYFGFDVDTNELARGHTLQLCDTLENEGIPRKHIHVSYSGGKGYHVELYIDGRMGFKRWVEFGRYIVAAAGLLGEKIEFRPEEENGRAFKLPLTFHPKTGAFAAFCDNRTLQQMSVLQSHDYFFHIEKMPEGVLFPILALARHQRKELERRQAEADTRQRQQEKRMQQAVMVRDERIFETTDAKRERIERYFHQGLPSTGLRWRATMDIAVYLFHEMGVHDPGDLRQILTEWTEHQIRNGVASTPLKKCLPDIDNAIKWACTKTDGFYARVRDLTVTAAEVTWILTVPERHARDLLWALLLVSKAYPRNDGTFFRSDRDLQRLLSVPKEMCRRTLSRHRRLLIDNGYICAHIPPPHKSFFDRKATVYKLMFDPPAESEVVDVLTFDDSMDCRRLLREIAAKLLDETELRRLKLAA